MKNIFILTLSFFSIINLGFSQNVSQFSTYMFNKMYFNPGYTGFQEDLTAQITYRSQWSNFDGAPKTIQASVQKPINIDKAGIGFSVITDQIGVTRNTFITLSYAYKIKLGAGGNFRVGLSAKLENHAIKYTELNRIDLEDANIPNEDVSLIKPNFGFGMFYNNKDFYIGYSLPRLSNDNIGESSFSTGARHHYFMTGKLFTISNNLKLYPSILVSYIPNAPIDINASLSTIIKDRIQIGANYRLGDSIDGFIRYFIKPQLSISGAYDFTFSELAEYSGSSFEVMVEYKLSKQVRTMNLRYF